MSEASGSGNEGSFSEDEIDISSKTTIESRTNEFIEKMEDCGDEHMDKVVEPVSYLPSWVLKMREKIATSRTAHADAEQRITQLHADVDTLSAKLLIMRPVITECNTDKSFVFNQKISRKEQKNYLCSLPTDLFTLILEYLQIKHILRLEVVSKSFRTMLDESNYWVEVFPLYCPHLQQFVSTSTSMSTIRSAASKACLLQYLKDIQTCMEFIQTMKDQRSVPKHRTVQPHRHTRQERQVSHPMPLFEHHSSSASTATSSSNRGGASNEQGSSWGQRANALRSADRIMSHAETLSSDFRSVAHKALHTMLILTSDCNDPAIYQLASEGAITVLTALLLNEEGSIQNDACAIIANLLCWEARKRLLFRQDRSKHTKGTHALTPSPRTLSTLLALFGPDVCEIDLVYPLRDQVLVCGGLKMLTSLLTSPTASINLASSSNKANSGQKGSVQYSTGSVKMSTTSSIQGICNKQASRALLALCYPEMPVSNGDGVNIAQHYSFASAIDIAAGRVITEKAHTTIVKSNDTNVNLALVQAAAPVSLTVSPHKIRLDPLPQYKNDNSILPAAPTAVMPDTTGTSIPTAVPHHPVIDSISVNYTPKSLRAPMISPLFLTDTSARPWLFSYFYKSGAVKDQFTAYLRFVPIYNTTSTSLAVDAGGIHAKSSINNIPNVYSNSGGYADTTTTGCVNPALAGAEMHGRGIDNIGAFTLTGKAQADIGGWTWHVEKSYVPVNFDSSSVYVDTTDAISDIVGGVGDDGTALHWVKSVDRDVANRGDNRSGTNGNSYSSSNSGGDSNSRAGVHVRHVAYWSSGVENTTYTAYSSTSPSAIGTATAVPGTDTRNTHVDPSTSNIVSATINGNATAAASNTANELNHIDEEPTGIWGLGLWGVWETSSGTSPHFELQKGGVFRAAPIIL